MSFDWKIGFDLVAGIASIIGLLFSYRASKRAQAATDVAREAREAVRKSNAGEELRQLDEKAKELLGLAQTDRLEGALVTSADLLARIVEASHRWRTFWGDEGFQRIRGAAKKVEKISDALSRPAPLAPDDREKVIEFCHAVVTVLAEETGKMWERLEKENSND